MRRLLSLALVFSAAPAFAQQKADPFKNVPPLPPVTPFPQTPPAPRPTQTYPAPAAPPVADPPPAEPGALPPLKPEVVLPQKEKLTRIDGNALTARRQGEKWVVAQGFSTYREFGTDEKGAEEFVRAVRAIRPTEWGTVGGGRGVVEYGLSDGKANPTAFGPKLAAGIDAATLRVEQVRGVWVLRDDDAILLNFGAAKEDAEQAAAVVRKYGFNRIGQAGAVGSGCAFLFAVEEDRAKDKGKERAKAGKFGELARAHQEEQLTRTGIELPKGGSAGGEKFAIDPKAVELKRDKFDWKLVCNGEELANFGASEWSGRDALKLVQELRFTECCRFNADVTFFLVNGQAPTKVPFAARATRFDREALAVKPASDGRYGIYEGGYRQLWVCDTEKEAGRLLKVVQQYGFDTSCQVGLTAQNSLKFLAKTGR